MGRKIRSLEVINGQYTKRFVVGVTKLGSKGGIKQVAEIRDTSQEYEDHIFRCYAVMDAEGYILARIENCPVMVEYETKEPGQ